MLTILAVLLVMQFIIVPIFSWQQEQLMQIEASSKRLVKANGVIARLPIITDTLIPTEQKNKTLEALYYNYVPINTFKLEFQQEIEKLFEQHHVKVRNFNWILEIPGEIAEQRIKIVFNGKVKDFALLQMKLAQLPKFLNIAEWTLQIDKMNETSLGTVNGSLVISAYILPSNVEAL